MRLQTVSATSPPLSQAERIRQAAEVSFAARSAYTAQQVTSLLKALSEAENGVSKALSRYESLGALSPGQEVNQEGLIQFQAVIAEVTGQLKSETTLLVRDFTKTAYKQGVHQGIEDLARAKLPLYADLTPEGVTKTASAAFAVMDTHALDFLVRKNIQLAGDVSGELSGNVQRIVTLGISQGRSLREVARDIGGVVKDKAAFLAAGNSAFKTAQQRMQTIARTETLRAHNQGRIKFYDHIGVQKLEWLALGDERQCRICGALHGNVFDTAKLPPIPRHPGCRCSVVTAHPLVICGAELGATAAPASAVCLLSPQAIQDQASAQHGEAVMVGQKVAAGQYEDLTAAQIQGLCKQQNIPIFMNNADYLAKLAKLEPGTDFSGLSGPALKAKVAQYKIGKVKTKDDLIAALKAVDSAKKQYAKEIAEKAQAPVTTPVALPDFASMSLKQLQDEAKSAGVGIYPTKAESVQWLDDLEPGVNHTALSGPALSAKKAQFGLGKVKTKDQLITDLHAKYKPAAVEKAKQEKALKEVQDAKIVLGSLLSGAKVFDAPQEVQLFHHHMDALHEHLAKYQPILPDADYQAFAAQVAAKQQAHTAKIEKIGSKDLKKFGQAAGIKYYQWASSSEIQTLLIADPTNTQAAKLSVFQKYKGWAEKHGSAKLKSELPALEEALKKGGTLPAPPKTSTPVPEPKAAPAPKPKTPKPAPVAAPKASPPAKLVSPVSAFQGKDEAWEKSPPTFAYVKEAKSLGGAHSKYIYKDAQGGEWLFKPVSEDFRASGDEVAYKIGRLIDPNSVEARVIEVNVPGQGKRLGSIQPLVPNLRPDKDFSGVSPLDLKPSELAQVQREHVIDWLISNHDGHSENFLRTQDGAIRGIDKGQLFKFLGQDKLDPDYHPNQVHGAGEPYYNTVMRQVRDGKLPAFDPAHTLAAIRQVETIPDDLYRELLRPYAEKRFKGNATGLQGFYQSALARKNAIRKDFEAYYGRMLKQPGFTFEAAEKAATKTAEAEAKAAGKLARIGQREMALLEEARRAGWQGKVIPLDSDQVEDQNMLAWTERLPDKSERSVLAFKVRPEAEASLKAFLDQHVKPTTAQKPKVGQPLSQDEEGGYFNKFLAAAKTLGKHVGDQQYNQGTLETMIQAMNELRPLLDHADLELSNMAQHYLDAGEKILAGVQSHQKLTTPLTQYLRKSAPGAKPEKSGGVKVTKGPVRVDQKKINKGVVEVAAQEVATTRLFKNASMNDGVQYTADFGDGMEIRYRPWVSQNHYAQQGQLEVLFKGALDPEKVEAALERLESLGVNAAFASPVDAEMMYLQKQAFILKRHTTADYKKVLADLKTKQASKEESVQALRTWWGKQLGVPDVTKLPGYDPVGVWQQGFHSGVDQAGYRHQLRFDIDPAKLRTEMKDYVLQHTLTNGEKISDFIELVLGNNGAMVSTVEKMRMGVPPGGMSPRADMDSGGATYFFTRIKKRTNTEAGLHFKIDLLRRMDAISYGHDKYGQVTGNDVTEERHSTIPDWKKISDNYGNETIFKYSVTLLDNLELIRAGSDAERTKILAAFKKHGVSKLADGRKVEDMVKVN